jgi:putative phosphoesterase
MRIAILSDIHGNQYALKVVLDRLSLLIIDQIYILGDFVGYYYGAQEVYDLLQPWNVRAIKGNHEKILSKLAGSSKLREEIVSKYGHGHINALNTLNQEALQYFLNLPDEQEVYQDSKKITLVHANPWGTDEYVYPNSNEETLNKLSEVKTDYLLYGHTHYPAYFKRGNTICINPGSVGQPRDKHALASFSTLEIGSGAVEFYKLEYEKQLLIREVEKVDPSNQYLKSVLER